MKKVLVLIMLVILLLLSSCGRIGIVSEPERVDARIEEIVAALKDQDSEALKSLFSKNAIDEDDEIDHDIAVLFDTIQGKIKSWEDDGWSSDTSMGGGKKSWMIQFSFDLTTDQDTYHFFVIDYSADTKDPNNEGVYMIELIKFTDEDDLEAWQDRMRAGIYIH